MTSADDQTGSTPSRRDPIGDKYFNPLRYAEVASDVAFYAAAVLSIVILVVEKPQYPALNDVAQILFVIAVVVGFAIGIAIRLYWRPRAEDHRRIELISNASKVALIVERTEGYYNNEQSDPTRRLGLNTFENSHFSRAIALEMLKAERVKVTIYALIFLVAVLNRKTELAVAAVAAQAILSEQILSHWLRLEWCRARFNNTYNDLYKLFQSDPNKSVLYARVLEIFSYYETTKANAGISLSSRIFHQKNAELSAEWETIKSTLKI